MSQRKRSEAHRGGSVVAVIVGISFTPTARLSFRVSVAAGRRHVPSPLPPSLPGGAAPPQHDGIAPGYGLPKEHFSAMFDVVFYPDKLFSDRAWDGAGNDILLKILEAEVLSTAMQSLHGIEDFLGNNNNKTTTTKQQQQNNDNKRTTTKQQQSNNKATKATK